MPSALSFLTLPLPCTPESPPYDALTANLPALIRHCSRAGLLEYRRLRGRAEFGVFVPDGQEVRRVAEAIHAGTVLPGTAHSTGRAPCAAGLKPSGHRV
jgi:hypothetical protein